MNARGGGASRSWSVAIAMNSPAIETVRRTAHWTSLSSPATLSSASERDCSLSKFQGRPHLTIITLLYRDRARAIHAFCFSCGCVYTRVQMPGCWCFNKAARVQLLLHYLYPRIQPSLASCSKLHFLQVVYENFTSGIWDLYHLLWPIRFQHLVQLWSKST